MTWAVIAGGVTLSSDEAAVTVPVRITAANERSCFSVVWRIGSLPVPTGAPLVSATRTGRAGRLVSAFLKGRTRILEFGGFAVECKIVALLSACDAARPRQAAPAPSTIPGRAVGQAPIRPS
ncbi:hypothetical protein GCM10007904_23930 [Oharaeibacter diazotrophicus]|nr:hypothetical protein GCM10007904_23930 [Oharaeibacter diazotrophicus]